MYIPNSKLSRKKREKNNNKEKIKTLLISTEDLPATSTKPISFFFFPHGEIQWENETRGRDERNKREERRERATKLISIKRNSA